MVPKIDSTTSTPTQSAWTPETPFEEVLSFETVAAPADLDRFSDFVSSPFLSEYRMGDVVIDETADDLRQLLSELYDEEFDEAVMQLVAEADAHVAQFSDGQGETPPATDLLLHEWAEPLRREADAMFDRLAEAMEDADVAALGEAQLDELLDRFEPHPVGLNPGFEGFIGKMWKKVKKAVKKVVKGAGKVIGQGIAAVGKILPIGLLLKQLKRLVNPLLKKVLKMALNKLPAGLRPAARQLARKLLGEIDTEAPLDGQLSTGPDVADLQYEFDLQILGLLAAPDDVAGELVVSEAVTDADQAEHHAIADLDAARARFVAEISRLEQGEDPTPAIEGFLPAILPALKVGIGLIGRRRVIGFIAGLLGKLIAPMVGKKVAPALSKAIADVGLRAISLETAPERDASLGPEAVAATLENTLARLAEAPDDLIGSDAALELAVHEAFREATAANFPSDLVKEELRETHDQSGAWVAMPRTGMRRYQKYLPVFKDVEITLKAAQAVATFGGGTLDQFVRDVLGLKPPLRANVHVYEGIPGTLLSRIAFYEKDVPGLGSGTRREWIQLHPLTPVAAGLLLGQPGLAKVVGPRFLASHHLTAVGQRFYYLEIPGARVQTAPASPGSTTAAVRRPSTVRIWTNAPFNLLLTVLFLSEERAQDIAARIRRNEPAAALAGDLLSLFKPLLAQRFSKPHPIRPRGARLRHQAGALDQDLRAILRSRIETLAIVELAAALGSQSFRRWFLEAAESPEDGVTIEFQMQHPGVTLLAELLERPGTPAQKVTAVFRAGGPTDRATVVNSGFRDR